MANSSSNNRIVPAAILRRIAELIQPEDLIVPAAFVEQLSAAVHANDAARDPDVNAELEQLLSLANMPED